MTVATEFAELAGHDAYELLGVPPDASAEEIRRAHRRLVKETHPDLFTDESAKAEANVRIRLLNAARTILDGRRAAYDAFRVEEDDEGPADSEIIEDPWDSATPGAPPPDPWDAEDWEPVPEPDPMPPPPPPPGPVHRPMPPPQYVFTPGAPYYAPPLRVRQRPSLIARGAIGCSLVGAAFVILLVIAAFVSAFTEDPIPAPAAAVPERLSGTWSGKVKDRDEQGAVWKVKFTLWAGWNNGRVDYLDGKCLGIAVPVKYKSKRLTVNTEFPDDKASWCDVGNVHLTLRKDGRLDVVYYDEEGKAESSGVLARAK